MPTYVFGCASCGARDEKFLTFSEYGDETKRPRCEKCKSAMTIRIETAPSVQGNGFRPYWNTGLGCIVHSAKEQDQVAAAKGLEPMC